MEPLGPRDFQALSDFLAGTYRLHDSAGFVAHLLEALPQVVRVNLIGYHEMHPSEARSENHWAPGGIANPSLDRAWEHHMDEHPVLTHFLQTQDGRALKISDFRSERRFHNGGLYHEFYRKMGVEDVLCYALPFSPPRVIGIALHRDKRSFTDRDSLLLNILRPHLAQSWLNARVVTSMREHIELAKRGVEKAELGIVILLRNGKVRFASSLATQWLRRYFPTDRKRLGLPEVVHHWVQQSNQASPLSCAGPLVAEREESRLVIRLVSEGGHLFLLMREEWDQVSAKQLRRLSLTGREADVLAWVARGKTNVQIGAILSMSPRTVQKHLEHIFCKLNVETRTAAASMAREMVARH